MSKLEAGSFRDRNGRIVYRDGQIYRLINEQARENWDLLMTSGLGPRLMESGKLVKTEEPGLAGLESLAEAVPGEWVSVLRHECIPVISYAYEWSFGMLKDAALLQLNLILAALDKGMILKDATPYNIQWQNLKPVFIDTPSFEKHGPNEPWVGYRQFCELYLFPLMLQSYKGIPLSQVLRSRMDGMEPEVANQIFSFRDRFRSGVFTHVYLQARMSGSYAGKQTNARARLKQAGFNQELIKANINGMRKLVKRLTWEPAGTEWGDYTEFHNYSDQDHEEKESFVEQACADLKPGMVWDLGANTGQFSRLAARHADCVVAADIDPAAVEKHYRQLKADGVTNILPVVMNLADPSPNWGWRGTERTDLASRAKPDLTLCLALIHHVVITANIPMADFVKWLAELGSSLVIEFVSREDEQVKKLLLNKDDQYHDYDQGVLENCLTQRFEIKKTKLLGSGNRTLYFCQSNQS